MKFKRIIALLTGAVVLVTSAISVSAVSYDKTETYYVYQQETYGEVTMYPSNASGNTYCELASALKMTSVTFWYADTDRFLSYTSGGSGAYVNNNECDWGDVTGPATKLNYALAAETQSGVKITSYITWTSAGCEDNAKVGSI